jgi:hypothetical protein
LLTKLRFFLSLLFGKQHDEWWLEAYRLSQKQWTLSSRTYKPPEKESSIFLLMLKEQFKKEVNHCLHTANWPLPFKKRFQDYSLILNERSMALLEGLLIFLPWNIEDIEKGPKWYLDNSSDPPLNSQQLKFHIQ